MDKKRKKEIIIFLSAIVVIVVTFAGGINYLRGATNPQGNSSLLGNISSVAQGQSTSTVIVAATTTDATTTTTTTAIVTLPVPQKTKSAPAPVKTTTTNTTKGGSSVSTSTVTAPAPKPAPVPTPTPAPVHTPATSTAPAAASSVSASLPYSVGTFGNTFGPNDGWTDWEGAVSKNDTALNIESTAKGETAGSLLAGSDGWSNYVFTAIVDWNEGESFGLIARYIDNKDYVVCDFQEPSVGDVLLTIHQHVNGKVIDLADGNIPNYEEAGGGNINVALSVQGNQAECIFGGYSISTLIASDALTGSGKGGIGFITSDSTPGNAEITVHTIGVSAGAYNLGSQNVQDVP